MTQAADRVLLDQPTASAWTGRSPRTLRRWATEGRITRYGPYHAPLYDLNELPERSQHRTPPRPTLDEADAVTT